MVVLIFGIAYLILDLFLVILFSLKMLDLFRAVFYIYMSNFLIIPAIGLADESLNHIL